MADLLVIGGERVAAAEGKTLEVIEPSTAEPMAEVAEAGPADARRAVGVASRAFEEGPWPRTSARERGRVLTKASLIIRERLEDLARLEARNGGKPIKAARGEIELVANVFEYWGGAANKIFGDRSRSCRRGSTSRSANRSGVCALITPWNFPAGDRFVEDRAGAGVRQRRDREAGLPDAAHRARARRHPRRGGAAGRHASASSRGRARRWPVR